MKTDQPHFLSRSAPQGNAPAPYLSVVVTSRNDNHGGDLRKRMQTFINSLAILCERHRLSTELVIVEWNPPPDRPKLADALSWPESGGFCGYRTIEVPPQRHARLAHSDQLPLFQMIGKNVGIRRARGEFIVATNVDLIFSDELVRWLAKRTLTRGKYYRVDRYDVPIDVMQFAALDDQLDYCRCNLLRVNSKFGTFSGADWTRCQNGVLGRLWPRAVPAILNMQRRFAGFGQLCLDISPRLVFKAFSRLCHRFRRVHRAVRPHTNGCGDFTLMSKSDWHRLLGYPEFEIFSWHLDGLLLFSAAAAGLTEVCVPHPLYHIEHAGGWTPEHADRLWQRLEEKGIPFLTNETLAERVAEVQQHKGHQFVNDANWGMATDRFDETSIAARGRPISTASGAEMPASAGA